MFTDPHNHDRFAALIAEVRRLTQFPGQYVAYQPANPDGRVLSMGPDMQGFSLIREVGAAALAVDALRSLLKWAHTDPRLACEMGVIVAADHSDADLDCSDPDHPGSGLIITAHQLACLRAFKIELVVLCRPSEILRRVAAQS